MAITTDTWDMENRLTNCLTPNGLNLVNNVSVNATSTYDANGLRRKLQRTAPPVSAGDKAVGIDWPLPRKMQASQIYQMSVTMRNTGTNSWPACSTYHLDYAPTPGANLWPAGSMYQLDYAPTPGANP